MELNWKITFSEKASIDLDEIKDYIYSISKSETISLNQIKKIVNAIDQLDHLPLRHQVYSEEPLYSKGIRYVIVNNYIIFYLPDEVTHDVGIVRIVYSKIDITHLDLE